MIMFFHLEETHQRKHQTKQLNESISNLTFFTAERSCVSQQLWKGIHITVRPWPKLNVYMLVDLVVFSGSQSRHRLQRIHAGYQKSYLIVVWKPNIIYNWWVSELCSHSYSQYQAYVHCWLKHVVESCRIFLDSSNLSLIPGALR